MVKVILFDFGGVIAEEGFREGLKEIAKRNGLHPGGFYAAAEALIGETGYLTGHADESAYWNALRERTGIRGTDRELRDEILKRFVIRPRMIAIVDSLRTRGFTIGLLSDQTNWLDELDEKKKSSGISIGSSILSAPVSASGKSRLSPKFAGCSE